MPTYLITNRPPRDYQPSAETMAARNAWFASLSDHLIDRGNPAFASRALGAPVTETRLGGYTLVEAKDLDAAVELAATCPILERGGGVEVGELTMLNKGTTQTSGALAEAAAVPTVTATPSALSLAAVDLDYARLVHVGASPDAVFDALTVPSQIASWWAPVSARAPKEACSASTLATTNCG